MTPAFRLLKFISFRPQDKFNDDRMGSAAIHDRFITVREPVRNEYGNDGPLLPSGTIIQMDFGGDFGFYGMADLDGVLTRCRIPVNELHKLDWSPFQHEIDGVMERAA